MNNVFPSQTLTNFNNELIFDSCFDSGNVAKVEEVTPYEVIYLFTYLYLAHRLIINK